MTIEEAREEILANFEESGLTPMPRAKLILDSYAVQLVRQRDARDRITEEGEIIAGPRDTPVPHPALATERAATAEISKLHQLLVKECRRPRQARP